MTQCAKHWLLQLLIALDQLLNVLVTPFARGAWADETLSSRAWRMWVKRRPFGLLFKPTIDFLFSWHSTDHCEKSFLNERAGRNLPPELRP